MPAPVDQQPGLASCNHCRTKRQPGDRAARSSADAIGERDDTGRTLVALLEAGGDDPDHPRMPVLGCSKDEDRRLGRSFHGRDRRRQGPRLDVPPLAVVGVELPREFASDDRIIGREQARAEVGGADPAAGVDPRPEQKAEMIDVDRLSDARDGG